MHAVCFLVSLLPDIRGHIPNQPSLESGPTNIWYGAPLVRAVATFLITVAFLSALLWLASRLVIGLL